MTHGVEMFGHGFASIGFTCQVYHKGFFLINKSLGFLGGQLSALEDVQGL